MTVDQTRATRRLAEFCGWHLPTDPELPRSWMRTDPELGEVWAGFWAETPPDPDNNPAAFLTGNRVWCPFGDLNDIALVESEIRRRGAQWRTEYLLLLEATTRGGQDHLSIAARYAFATASQRAEAALRVIEEMGRKEVLGG